MRKLLLSLFLVCVSAQIQGQTSSVEQLGAIPATQPATGLGWTMDTGNQWEFQQAAAAGAKHFRFQCTWADGYGGRQGGGELQSLPPSNSSMGYQLPPACAQGIANAKQYGMQPLITAAYGSPYQQILSVQLTSAVGVGATSLPVSFSSGVGGLTLSSIQYPYDYVYSSVNNGAISNAHSYPGTLITGSAMHGTNSATLNLSSATSVALPAGTVLQINRVLYPSASTESPNDASVQAYVGYVRFLGEQCAAAGISCQIGLWNEPAWGADCWDNRRDCYDQNPGYNEQFYGANYGFVAALQATAPIPGVTYVWAGTDKTGDGSVLGPNMTQYSGTTFSQTNNPVAAESFHPYGDNPEDNMWNLPCVQAQPTSTNWPACNTLAGSSGNGAEVMFRTLALQQSNPSFHLDFDVTETGYDLEWGPDQAHQARYNMRQFLGYMAAGVKVVDFYQLYDCFQGFGFTNTVVQNGSCAPLTSTPATPRPTYTAMAGVESDLAPIANAPATSYSLSSLSSVASYSGTYPLAIGHLVGSRNGDTQNSDLVVMWQLSSCSSYACWPGLGQPAAGPVVLNIPSGMTVASATNLDTRAAVPFSVSGQQVSVNVSDDPIGIMLHPSSSSTPSKPTSQVATSLSITTTKTGSGSSEMVTITGRITPYSSGTLTTNGGQVAFWDNQTSLGFAPLSSGVASITVKASSLVQGASELMVIYNGTGTGPGTFGPSGALANLTTP